MKNSDFYNALASNYDDMINLNGALERRKILLMPFIHSGMKTAADLGCGSGIDSISLAGLGLKVVAFDPSEEMLNKASQNAISARADNIKFSKYCIHEIPNDYFNKFDVITSLGNTLSNISPDSLQASVESIFKLTKTNGKAIIQIINYNSLVSKNDRVLNITSNEEKTFIRFYDFMETHINFNILTFNTGNPAERSLISTKVYNYSADFLINVFKSSGFYNISVYGDLKLNNYIEETSKDIVIIAEK